MVIKAKIFKLLIIFLFFIQIYLIIYYLKNQLIYNNGNIFKGQNYLNQKKFFKSNSNIIQVENRIYYNKSLGLNYLDICQKNFLMKFNRNIPNFNSNILITLILIYPNPFDKLKLKLADYIDIISREVDFNFSLAIITCNHDISNLMINNYSQINLKYISKFNLNNIEIPNSECFSFVTYSGNKTIDVFYTNTKYSKFEKFINKFHYTSIKKYKFKGYYAAGTNYYAYVPSHVGLFDFFDFFLKFDHDLIKKLKNKQSFEPFPLKKMIQNNNYFFFGCKFRHDAYFVTNNLYKAFFMFSLRQTDKCKHTILPVNLYKYQESISSPGAVNICWLGFYSMLYIRLFSEEYLSAPYGLYKNRWGDQQFFIPTLYGLNYRNKSYFNKNTYLCSWLK